MAKDINKVETSDGDVISMAVKCYVILWVNVEHLNKIFIQPGLNNTVLLPV